MILAAPTPPARKPDDRWSVLVDLMKCRQAYGLNDRDMAVLRGLISCLPKAGCGQTFVFASNITLSNRTDGMNERTLRRHLAKLIAAGLIVRHASPNGKRYVRRNHLGQAAHAFGFDLSPLFDLHADIAASAAAAILQADAVAALREELSLLRHQLYATDPDFANHIRKTLRRNLGADALRGVINVAKIKITAADRAVFPCGMTANDSHFVRHIQKSIKDLDLSEKCCEIEQIKRTDDGAKQTPPKQALPSLDLVIEACPDIGVYAAEPVRSWPDLIRFADIMAPMLQIDRCVVTEARRRMGAAAVAVAVLCILQLGTRVRSAGAYLRGLSLRAALGQFSPDLMVKALLAKQIGAGAGG